MDSLTQAIVSLYESERFYAEIILQMDRIISKRVPTAGVCIKDRVQLYVNPDYFESKTLKERVGLLKHECQHILNDHIARSKEAAPDVYAEQKDAAGNIIAQMKHKVINIAADCAINPGIPNLPEGGVFPKHFDLRDGETLEWYLKELKQNDKCKQLTEYDEHSLWAESEGEKEELKQKIRQAVNKAAEKARGAGRMTAEDELLVSKLNKATRNWKQEFRRFAARVMEVTMDTSKKKRNRRYGVTFPGHIKVERLRIGVAVDTSGSMSDESINQAMAEIGNMAKYAEVVVVEADTEIKNAYIYDPKKKYKVKGRGGTAYQPAFDHFNKEEVDGVIYIGDMDCFDREEIKKPKYPVLWAVIGQQKPPVEWGSQITIEVNEK